MPPCAAPGRPAATGWAFRNADAWSAGPRTRGLLDPPPPDLVKSLFDPDYLGLRLLDHGYLPGLGMSAWRTVFVVTLHTVWSAAVLIAPKADAAGNAVLAAGAVVLPLVANRRVTGLRHQAYGVAPVPRDCQRPPTDPGV
jgi:hypothetical protein